MTTTRQAFIEDILADLDNDAPRLIFADWLDENGDPQRAEFIRVQCDLAQMSKDNPNRDSFQKREESLLQSNAIEWLAPLREVIDVDRHSASNFWSRGFLCEVPLLLNRFVQDIETILQQEVVQAVSLCLDLPKETEDQIRDEELCEIWWVESFDSPKLANFRPEDQAWLRTVYESPRLQLVTNFAAPEVAGVPAGWLPYLFSSPNLTRLQGVGLFSQPVTIDGIRFLVHPARPFRLKHICLIDVIEYRPQPNNPKAIEMAKVLAGSPALSELGSLYLCRNGLGDQGMQVLIDSPYLPTSLNLYWDGDKSRYGEDETIWDALEDRFDLD